MKRLLLVEIKKPVGKKLVRVTAVALFSLSFLFTAVSSVAQTTTEQQKADYRKTVTDRASKIVATLAISDSARFHAVTNMIADQYTALSDIQNNNSKDVAAIKAGTAAGAALDSALKAQDQKKSAAVAQLHAAFLARLQTQLNEEQIDKVKDGLTYRVFPLTYAAYLDEIPALTSEQKAKIYDWLKEAREIAMDGESSDKKHAVFGKYKGRINNYLSAQGYDMKKEGEEWAKRRQAANDAKQSPGKPAQR